MGSFELKEPEPFRIMFTSIPAPAFRIFNAYRQDPPLDCRSERRFPFRGKCFFVKTEMFPLETVSLHPNPNISP